MDDGVALQQNRAVHRSAALAVLCISLLIITLDNTVLNVALPTLVRDLHATTNELQWIVSAYTLVFAGLLLAAGSLADRIGRKLTFLLGLIAFALGSTWAAFSGSVNVLIAARASMGIGAALIMPSTLSIITDMFTDPAERQRAFGIWSATSGAGIALGPIVGGLLLSRFWWGSVFLINVPIAAVGVICALPVIPNSKDPAAQRPDLIGALLSMSGLGALLWGIIEAPVQGWSSVSVLVTIASGLAVLVAFVVWELVTTHPMLDLGFFRNRSFSFATSSIGLVAFGLFGALFVLTQFLQFSLGYSAIEAGIRILPAAGAIAVVAPFSTVLVRVMGTKVTVAAGLMMVAGGLWQIAGASINTTYSGTLLGVVLLGIGTGLVIPSATASAMGTLPTERTGVGAATNNTFLQVGGVLGVAIMGSLLSTRYKGDLTRALAPYHVPQGIESVILGSLGGALSVAQHVPAAIAARLVDTARSAFISGMDLGLLTGAIVVLAAGVMALVALPARQRTEETRSSSPATHHSLSQLEATKHDRSREP